MEEENKKGCVYWLGKIWLGFSYFYGTLVYLAVVCLVLYGIVTNNNLFYQTYQTPWYVSLIIFFFLLFLLGSLEGIQISLITLMKQPPELYKDDYKITWYSSRICRKPNNLERFLQGRQMLVTVTAFFLASLTTVTTDGVFPAGLEQGLLSTGLIGALMVTITSQLSPRLVAILNPVPFMNNFAEHVIFLLCLAIEALGLGFCAWIIAAIITKVTQLKVEENEEHELQEVLNDNPNNPNQRDLLEELDREEFDFVKYLAANPLQGEHLKSQSSILQLLEYSQGVSTNGVAIPSAEKLASLCSERGLTVPVFLLAPTDAKYVPSHVYACHALAENQTKLRQRFSRPKDDKKFSDLNKASLAGNIFTAVSNVVKFLLPPQLEKTI